MVEELALTVLGKLVNKTFGGLDLSRIPNALMRRRANRLEARGDLEVASIDVLTDIMRGIGDSARDAVVDRDTVRLRALSRISGVIERKEVNVEKALLVAAAELTDGGPGSMPSDDWWLTWQDGAEYGSYDHLRRLWGRVLAQEIRKTGSVSKRTMAVLKTIDKETALAFQRMRSLAIQIPGQGGLPRYVVPANHDDPDHDDRFAVDFHTRELMNADGLVLSSSVGHTVTVSAGDTIVEYQGKPWILAPASSRVIERNERIKLNCSPMGITGNEIAKVVDMMPDPIHQGKLIAYLLRTRIALVPMPADCRFGQPIPEKHRNHAHDHRSSRSILW